jgi:4-hydroxybenzoate polyprenyltransferase
MTIAQVWLFLLQFNAANQMFTMEEDALNKPYRPIPAGLITIGKAKVLRWGLVPLCLGLSWIFEVIYLGLSLSVAFILYNECGLDRYWFTKNALNAIGLVSWNVGAASIACGGKQVPSNA